MLLNKEIEHLKIIITKAGTIARKAQKQQFTVKRKQDTSIVTDIDLRVQNYLIDKITKRYPSCNLIYEEGYEAKQGNINNDTLSFIIDPIDGTAMYSMHLPNWCVSVGVFKGFVPVYGFVYAPVADMLFYNNNDRVFLNNDPISIRNDLVIDQQTNIFFAAEYNLFSGIYFKGKIRNIGSTALHACLTVDNARNRTIAFIGKSRLWDWAGAIPIILKAGGKLIYIDGRELNIHEIFENNCALPEFLIAYNSVGLADLQNIFIPLKK